MTKGIKKPDQLRPVLHLSRPADRSLSEFEAWVTEFCDALGAPPGDKETTEEEWRKDWEEFWRETDTSSKMSSAPARRAR